MIHITRIQGKDVFGHYTDHCDPQGCWGHDYEFKNLATAETRVGDVVSVPGVYSVRNERGALLADDLGEDEAEAAALRLSEQHSGLLKIYGPNCPNGKLRTPTRWPGQSRDS